MSTQLNTCVCVANNNADVDDDDDKGDYHDFIDDVVNVLGEEIVDGKWDGCGSKELELSRKVGSKENKTVIMVSFCQGCRYCNHYQQIVNVH